MSEEWGYEVMGDLERGYSSKGEALDFAQDHVNAEGTPGNTYDVTVGKIDETDHDKILRDIDKSLNKFICDMFNILENNGYKTGYRDNGNVGDTLNDIVQEYVEGLDIGFALVDTEDVELTCVNEEEDNA